MASSYSSTLLRNILIFHSDNSQSLFCLIICCIQQFHWLIILSDNLFHFGAEFFSTPKWKENFQYKENKLLCFQQVHLRKVKILLSAEKLVQSVQWLSLLHNFIQLSLNLGSAQAQILLAACWRFVMVRISDNGPGWKLGQMLFVGQPHRKNNSS